MRDPGVLGHPETGQAPTPIFIIGAARNGTTSLGNMVAASHEVASAEHWLHFGEDESNILRNKRYWGSLSDLDDYVRFLHLYAASDRFRLCRGDVTFHLQHRARDFFTFFLDLMDRFACLEGKRFWVTKLDPTFFVHEAELEQFLAVLTARYPDVRFVRIQRDSVQAFMSYLYMPGHRRHLRRRRWLLVPAIVLYAARYAATYTNQVIEQHYPVLHVDFESYVADRRQFQTRMFDFLGMMPSANEDQPERLPLNSSFDERRPSVSSRLDATVRLVSGALTTMPGLARLLVRQTERMLQPVEPVSRRLLLYDHYREQLLDDLRDRGESALIRAMEEREARQAQRSDDRLTWPPSTPGTDRRPTSGG